MNIRELEAAVSAIEDSYILEAGETIGRQERTARKLPHRLPLQFPCGLPSRFSPPKTPVCRSQVNFCKSLPTLAHGSSRRGEFSRDNAAKACYNI